MNKTLYRSRSNKMIAGVCGGIGEYFNIDPTIVRILWVLCSFSGIGLLAYLIAAIIIPEEGSSQAEYTERVGSTPKDANLIIGGILVVLGILLIGRHFIRWFDSGIVWSLIFIAAGAYIIFRGRRR